MVRNFYIKGTVDGRKTQISGGSSRKDGGMELLLTQMDEGSIKECVSIKCSADGHSLRTVIYDNEGRIIYDYETKR